MGWVVNATPCRFTPGNDTVPVVQEAAWAPRRVLTGAKNNASTGIRSVKPVASRYTD